MAQKTITIMADFGFGPYAWLKDSTDQTSYVGGNLADAVCGFLGNPEVSKELESDFAAWVTDFECHYDAKDFDWKAFNEKGIALSHRLKLEIKDAFDIVYVAPFEDPNEGTSLGIKITND